MIANITKGEDFGGIFRYLLKENKDAEIIGGNVGGQTPQELATEFEMFSSLNPKVQKTVTHFSLAFAPSDGEIDRETKVRIADRIITEMGYGYAQHLIVSHGRNDPGHDEEHNHDHLHIVANSVDLSGQWVDDFQNYPRLEKMLRQIEQAENLRQVQSSWQAKHHAPTHGQKQRHKRELREVAEGVRDVATAPVSDRLQLAIDRAATTNQTVGDFAVQLAHAGITCKLKITRTGKVQGISYQMEGVSFQGNQLYDASLPKLQSVHSLDFEAVRDPNRSATGWSKRGQLPFKVADERQAAKLARNYDHIIIDTQARPELEDLAALVEGCDLLVIPSTPDALALDALMQTVDALHKFKAEQYKVLLTIVPPKPSRDGEAARAEMLGMELPIFQTSIRRLSAFQKAALMGVPVYEVKDKKASDAWSDYQAVGKEILK